MLHKQEKNESKVEHRYDSGMCARTVGCRSGSSSLHCMEISSCLTKHTVNRHRVHTEGGPASANSPSAIMGRLNLEHLC